MRTRRWPIGEMLADLACRHRRLQSNTRLPHWGSAAVVGILHAALLVPVAAAQNPVYPAGPPWRPVPSAQFNGRDLRQELKNKTTDTFTVASVGDMFWKTPVAKRMSAPLRDILRNADITIGNLEGGVGFDPDLTASAMADLGFDFLAPGEFGGSPELQIAMQALGKFGIKLAGAGPDLTTARRPAFQEVPEGLVAFLHACPGDNLCGPRATSTSQGVNPLGVTVWNTVTTEQFNQLKALEASILARRNETDVVLPTALPPALPPGRLRWLGQNYMVADKPGELRHELNRADEQALVLAVRNAKELSDFVIFHMHDHLNRSLFQAYSHNNYPADYLRPFLHKLIDNGLDMYVGSGVHTVQGIEIYKGRPIFYNQGNIGIDLVRGLDSTPDSHGMTRTELMERQRAGFFNDESNSIAYVANTTYQDGKLVEIRIYPVDIGLGTRPWSRENVPTTPTPEKARSILERIQKYSEPFGTKISIENNIGVIHVPPEATVDVGADLDIPGRRSDRQ
jgi:poly-gamma-glutamate capsule biosynthesis protein CapA/YwtB (metallophosphatase superfamily)